METRGAQREALEAIGREVYFAGLEVHKHLGPGMLENAYQVCYVHELSSRGLKVASEVPLAIDYKGLSVPNAYRIDILVEDCLPIELKSVEEIHPRHKAQLLTYLKYGGFQLGFLINFNVRLFKTGLTRLVNGL